MRGEKTTVEHADFKLGLNASPGVFARSDAGFSEAVNVYVDANDDIALRPPLQVRDIALSANCQGLWRINGVWYTIAKRGDTVTNTGAWAPNVTVLRFDAPPETTAWALKTWAILDDTLCVFIEHDRNSTATPKALFLHVLDGLAGYPTYVFDPAAPNYYHPEQPQQFAGPADPPSYRQFTPVVCTGHGKLWAARNDGNVQFCAIGRPRVWSPRDATSLESDGVTYYHAAPSGGAMFTFYVPWITTDLTDIAKVTTYKVQRFDSSTRAWVDLTVTGGVPGATQFKIAAVSGGSAPAWALPAPDGCTQVDVGPQTDGTIVRFLVSIKVDLASSWYIAKHQENLDYWAADGEADYIYTAGQESSGEVISALAILRNRLFVGYPTSSSLWEVGALAVDSAFLDSYPYGATGKPTLVGQLLVVSTAQGPRGVMLEGQNFQGISDRNIGTTLPVSANIRLGAGTFWPWNNLTVFPATADWTSYAADSHLPAGSVLRAYGGSVTRMLAFQWSQEREVNAWVWWDLSVTPTSDFIPVEETLTFRAGAGVYYFDAAASPSVGDNGVAYSGRISWHFRKPGSRLRVCSAEIVGTGTWTVSTSTAFWLAEPPVDGSSRLEDVTVDRKKGALTGTGTAYALIITGESADAPTLTSVAIDVLPLGK